MLYAKRSWTIYIAGLLLAVGISACSGQATTPAPTAGSLTTTEQIGEGQVLITHVDVQVYNSIPELTKAASVVIIGRVTGTSAPQNTERDPLDHSREAPNSKSISQLYRVTVERWLKGNGPKEIEVGVPDYVVKSNGDRFKQPYAQLEVGQRYALFLTKIDFYHGIAIPWQFLLKAGRAEARAGEGFSENLKPMAGLTEAALIRMVEAAVAQGR